MRERRTHLGMGFDREYESRWPHKTFRNHSAGSLHPALRNDQSHFLSRKGKKEKEMKNERNAKTMKEVGKSRPKGIK